MISSGVTVVVPSGSVRGTTGSTTVPSKWGTRNLHPRTGRPRELATRRRSLRRGPEREHVEGAHPVALAGETEGAQILGHDQPLNLVVGRLVDEDLAGTGRRLQPRGDVDRVADDGVV